MGSSPDRILCSFMPSSVHCTVFNHSNLTTHKPRSRPGGDEVLHNHAPAIAHVGSENNVDMLHPTHHRNGSPKKSPLKMPPRLPLSPQPYLDTAAEHLGRGTSPCTPHAPSGLDGSRETEALAPNAQPSSLPTLLNSCSISVKWLLKYCFPS